MTYEAGKRVFDILAAVFGLILLSPFFLLIALLIKLDTSGPVFYGGRRVGKGGRVFTMFKFRTMVADAERVGPSVTYAADPRITRLGHWLRDARGDEFPQLWNVLKGDMSLVGPRPESVYYFERYTQEQKQIFRVQPGLTGPSQIRYRHEEEMLGDPETVDRDYLEKVLPAKVVIDLDYVQRRSFLLDLALIIRTLAALIKDRFVGTAVAFSEPTDVGR